MSGQYPARILHPAVAFEQRFEQIPTSSRSHNDQSKADPMKRRGKDAIPKIGYEIEKHGKTRRQDQGNDQPLDRLLRGDALAEPMASKQRPRAIGKRVAHPKDDKKCQRNGRPIVQQHRAQNCKGQSHPQCR